MFGFDDYQGLRQSLGRDACDGYMGKLALEIRQSLRGADRLFRMAADEFVVLLPETDLKGARVAAERLKAVTEKVEALAAAGKLNPRIRVGGAIFPHERVRSSEDLLREAHRSYRTLQSSAKYVFEM